MTHLHINIDELSFVLHRGEDMKMECYLDMQSGVILNIPTNEKLLARIHRGAVDSSNINHRYFVDQLANQKNDQYIYIPDLFKQHVFNLMSAYTNSLPGESFSTIDELWTAIHGDGGYSEFYAIIKRSKKTLDLYISFRDEIFEKWAREWLEENDINLLPVDSMDTVH